MNFLSNHSNFIQIQGKALCSKAGAFVLLSNGETIFVEEKDDWGEIEGKIIEIEGVLEIEEQFPTQESLINDKGEYIQGMVGEKKILKNVIFRKVLNDY
jgi:hypothetical protein